MIRRPPRSTLFPYTPLSPSREPRAPSSCSSDTTKADGASKRGPASPWMPKEPRRRRYRHTVERDGLLLDTRFVPDRKSTRLNSSHQIISYAVFCLKKKKHNQ